MAGMVIIGGGLAGESAAAQLREDGYDGEITIVTAERHGPYQRPPLSKGFLAGTDDITEVILHDSDWYDDRNISVIEGDGAEDIDPVQHTVTLKDGQEIGYEKLLLVTGSSARQLRIPGAELRGVQTLRTLDDSEALRAALEKGDRKVAIIGSGWIGMEVAATARSYGNEVTVLSRDAVPLANALGDEIGKEFQKLHEDHGVTFRAPVSVDGFVGDDNVEGVIVDGEVVPADLVVVGVGAVPNLSLAEKIGLDVDNGVQTDASLRTSEPDIYAAGDIANSFHPVIGGRIRSEHWQNAISSGQVAAKAMLGQDAKHDAIPYFFTDQYDLGMELSGYAPWMRDADIVIRGDLPGKEFIAFWVKDGRVVAGMNVNIWDVNETIQKIIAGGKHFDAETLKDEAISLEELAAS